MVPLVGGACDSLSIEDDCSRMWDDSQVGPSRYYDVPYQSLIKVFLKERIDQEMEQR